MNLVARQIFGNSGLSGTNTEIGGVASTISTAALLATKLGISVSTISNFSIVGSDIKCKIIGSYAIPSGDGVFGFQGVAVTYYNDFDKLITNVGASSFYAAETLSTIPYDINFKNCLTIGSLTFARTSIINLYLKSLTSCGNQAFYQIISRFKTIYIPNCTSLGSSVGDNSVFQGISNIATIYCHPSLATNNSGAPDGDIAYAISQGAMVRYVTNFTAPNPVTTLSAGTIYNTAIQLNFTPPSSTNTIDYYEVYKDGILQTQKITASGQYLTGLTASTSYNITLIAVDIFFNKSVVSNNLNVSTNTTNAVPIDGLISYYKLDETSIGGVVDSFGSTNLVNTGITINQIGKIGQSYQATAASQYLNSTSFTSITSNISFNLWVYRTTTGVGTYPSLISTGSYGTNSGMGVFINPAGDIGWIINQDYNHWSSLSNISLNTWTMVTVTYDGSNVKIYLNGVLKRTDAKTGSIGSTNLLRLFSRQENDGTFIGKIDEPAIYNTALTQAQIDILYNSGTGITL